MFHALEKHIYSRVIGYSVSISRENLVAGVVQTSQYPYTNFLPLVLTVPERSVNSLLESVASSILSALLVLVLLCFEDLSLDAYILRMFMSLWEN